MSARITLTIILLTSLITGCNTITGESVTVLDGDQRHTFRTDVGTVGQLLQTEGFNLRPVDIVTPPLDTPLQDGVVIHIDRAPRLDIILDGITLPVYTQAETLRGILADAGYTLNPTDTVYANNIFYPSSKWDEIWPLPPESIRITTASDLAPPPAQTSPPPVAITQPDEPPLLSGPTGQTHTLTIIDGQNTHQLASNAPTIGRALAEAGLITRLADGITPPLWTPLAGDITVTIDRAQAITIAADGHTLSTRSHGQTVAAVLAEVGLALAGADYTIPALAEPVPEGGPIQVVRVTTETITEQFPLPYDRQWKAVADLPLDQTSLVQAGQSGIQARRVLVRYENGVEVAREVQDEWLVRPPTPEILGYGTQIVIQTVDTPDGPIEYWRSATFYAVSYSPSRSGTPTSAPWYGRTRTGKRLTVGMIAVDPNVIPLGTQLYIPGYGYASAEDTGGGVVGRLIDLGYEDHNYVAWHQNVTVYWRTPAPPADQIIWVLPK